MTGAPISVEVRSGVAHVLLDRGDKHNALDLPMFEGLRDAQERLRRDPEVRVVVVSGAGPSFCSGIDVATLGKGRSELALLLDRPPGEAANLAQQAALGWRTLPVPVFAAVHGACFGGGLQIALGCDLRFVAPDARLSVMEVKLGLLPDMALSQTARGSVAPDVLLELALSGRQVIGTEAGSLGLATRVVADPLETALGLAREVAGTAAAAIRGIKLLFGAGRSPSAAGLALETELMRQLIDKGVQQ